MSSRVYRQLDIWWVDLEPAVGVETRKKRPCVIIQADAMNRGSQSLIVAPVLPSHKKWPFVVNVNPSKGNGLDKERHINLKQMRTADLSRVDSQLGVLEPRYFYAIEEALRVIFGISA